jgi:NifU-like protein involved in Fe-S cluster formation
MSEHTATGDNPLCGDTVTVSVVTDVGADADVAGGAAAAGGGVAAKGGCAPAAAQDARIVDASWSGYGCELCLGTADRLMEEVKGRTAAEALELTGEEMLGWYGEQQIGRMRQDCVLLPLKVLRKALGG